MTDEQIQKLKAKKLAKYQERYADQIKALHNKDATAKAAERKAHRKAYRRQWAIDNADKLRAARQRWNAKHPTYAAEYAARRRVRDAGGNGQK